MEIKHISSGTLGQRNQSMEVFKLFASFLVVFIHCSFPGALGRWISPLLRIAVPGFFAISGFFSFQVTWQKLNKRIRHILILTAGAIAAEVLAGFVSVEFLGMYAQEFSGSTVAYLRSLIPTAQELLYWILGHLSPFREAHWYLAAILFCYCVLWLYTRFFQGEQISYRPFYGICAVLYLVYLTEGTMTRIPFGDGQSSVFLRSGWFFGLPMFAMGMFLRQYGQRIWKNFALSPGKVMLLTLAAIAFSILESFTIGHLDMYLGSTIAVALLVLLFGEYPRVTNRASLSRIIGRFGFLSTTIYILHPIVIDLEEALLAPTLSWQVPGYPYLRPLMVLMASLLLALIWDLLWSVLTKGLQKENR